MLHKRVVRILTFAVAAGILVLSLIPKPPEIPGGFQFADKIAHFIAYIVLSFLVFTSFIGNARAGGWLTTVLLVAVLCILFGGLIEILQMFTRRLPEFWDLTVDSIGALCGALAGVGLRRRVRRPKQG